MTVDETLVVCKVLQEHGYGDYRMTNECGCDALSEYADYIDDENCEINMEGWYERHGDLPINKHIRRALLMHENK